MTSTEIYSGLQDIFKKIPKDVLEEILKNCYVLDFSTKSLCRKWSFDNVNDCKKHEYIQTNPKFSNFKHTIFHAGTKEQFYEYSSSMSKRDSLTFDYIFDNFKKGIYVSIKDNKIEVFLPFSNTNYKNDWSQFLKVPEKYKRGSILKKQIKDIKKLESKIYWMKNDPDIVAFAKENDSKKNFSKKKDVNSDPSRWYANNYMFRNEINWKDKTDLSGTIDEGDKSIANFLELLTELCLYRNIPDSTFFINPRDFPILKKDGTHPYDAIFKPNNDVPEITKKQKKFSPIFSQAVTSDYLDVSIPTDDDIVNFLKVITLPSCKEPTDFNRKLPKWSSRKDTAIFRGSATGGGLTEKNNKRIQLAYISEITEEQGLLDCKLTSLNKRMKKDPLNDYLDYLNPNKMITGSIFNLPRDILEMVPINDLVGKFMDMSDQLKYKYVIDVEGHTAAFRLSELFSRKSLVLKVDGPWTLWFEKSLKGLYYDEITSSNYKKIHYIKIKVVNGVIDAQHLLDTIEWCHENDSKSEKIAKKGYKFYEKNLNRDSVLDYMQKSFEK
jgi:hypothetical protein